MGYQSTYKQVSISTANPSKLLLMLYDGLVRFVRQAIHSISNGDIETAHKALTKAQNIVLELRGTLKHEYAPELSQSLEDLYSYFYNQFVEANVKKSAKELEEVMPLILELQEAFSQAAQQVAQQVAGQEGLSK